MSTDWKSVDALERLIAALIASKGGKVDNMAVERYFNDSHDTIENCCHIYQRAALTLIKDAEDTSRIDQDMRKRSGAPEKTATAKKGPPPLTISGRVTKRASKTTSMSHGRVLQAMGYRMDRIAPVLPSATLALPALPGPWARSAPLPIVLPGNDNASDDKQVSTPSKRPKPPKTPKAIAKGSNKLQAKPPKSDDGEEEEEEVEEVEDGSVKVKEESLQLLKTTLERLRNSELLQCDSRLVHRQDGTSGEIAVCLSPFFPA
ncbi:hypothetical protein D6D28_06035 [Aureobasidium pullulans]|uniref:Uncharacterized protein n=1 Tax=Aureobasidium pullulans TaxID=5580 RepID=A0A4S8SFC5_AURPU|nr:hypothetical protein D6D28_06035 [Aureobasidium pullulans]